MSDIKKGAGRRAAKLAGLPIGVAGRAAVGAAKRAAGGDKDEINAQLQARAAEQLFEVLGELKGGAMKVGQALSVFETAIPEEYAKPYRESLAKLQAEAPALPGPVVHKVLDQQLGTNWRNRIHDFDDEAAASASIGQVHRATYEDGRPVAVKIQYPGADDALRADLKTMKRMASIMSPLMPGADVKSLVQELIDRTDAELDYRSEARNQKAFAAAYDNDPDFVIPKVIASSPKVIVSEFIEGMPLRKLLDGGSQAARDNAVTRLTEFNFGSTYKCGLLHGDPHPGNFLIIGDPEDGKLGVLDFGAVGIYPDGIPSYLGTMLRLARDEKYDELFPMLRDHGFLAPKAQATAEDVRDLFQVYIDPLSAESFHFDREWMQQTALRATDVRSSSFKTGRQMTAPADLVMLFRVIGGMVGIAAQLDSNCRYREIAEKWIPELSQ